MEQNSYCVPWALAFVAGVTPNEVAAIIKDARVREETGRRPGRAVRAVGRSLYTSAAVLGRLGLRIVATVERPGMTVAKWAANRAKWNDKGTWLVRVAGHLVVYRDGVIYDNQRPAGIPATSYRSRVCNAWLVSGIA